jgi:1-acyl-sn-glycerol-3-phosphate acyltransferase
MRSLPRLLAAGARLFYRLDVSGRAPAAGPVLFVANHPNSLLDPALVSVAAGREVRFLAKHTLFDDPKVGWLVRAAGSVPVYRQQDGPAPAGANDAMFAAARAVLAAGGAVGVFGEGVSHADPAMRPLKTGPARLALGAARELGRAVPVVPVGLTLADRATFRSAALVVVGEPVAWDDLAGRPDSDAEAVRALTARADAALRAVTANFDTWDDARLVAFAEAVHAAETAADPAASGTGPTPERLARWRVGADAVRRLRGGPERSDDPAAAAEADALARDLRAHRRLLGVLRMTPADLHERTDLGTAAWWALRRVPLAAGGAVAALGAALAWPAYRAVGVVAARMPGADATDVRATSKFLVGALVFLVWTVALAVVAGVVVGRAGGAGWGLVAAAVTLVAAPALALHTLRTAEGWDAARRDARRFLRLRGRGEQVTELRARQRGLAERVAAAVTRAAAAVEPRTDDARPPAQGAPGRGVRPAG